MRVVALPSAHSAGCWGTGHALEEQREQLPRKALDADHLLFDSLWTPFFPAFDYFYLWLLHDKTQISSKSTDESRLLPPPHTSPKPSITLEGERRNHDLICYFLGAGLGLGTI